MSKVKISDKELEAIAVMRDISILLYSEISENLKKDSECLEAVFEYLDGLYSIGIAEMGKQEVEKT